MTRPEPQPARGRGPGGFGDRIRALPWLVGGAPRPVLGILGGVLVVLGLFLFLRPLTAVQTLGLYVALSCLVAGVSDLLTPRRGSDASGSGLPPASALVWLVAGLSGLAWWSRDGDLFAPAIGAFLLVSGAVHLARFAARRSWDLLDTALLGVAELLFGALAFAWHDATVVVAGVLFGGRTVAFGITLLARALGRTPQPATRRRPRVLRISLAALLLLTAAGTTALSHGLRSGGPVLDSFYATPATLPDKPGVLVRTAPYEHELPAGMRGIRIYYTTTDAQDRIVPSTGLLVVPDHPRAPMPLITWAHGTVGVARACAPSNLAGAFAPDQEPAAGEFARLGWAFVATDYPGMGAAGAFPYLIGQGEGRAVLDAARAAREVAGLTFSDKTVIWGHSQGGHGALWSALPCELALPA